MMIVVGLLPLQVRKYRLRNKHRADAMHIFFPPIRPNHRGDSYNASIDLWSSITLARQCQGQEDLSHSCLYFVF
jgi:hypothetical protein